MSNIELQNDLEYQMTAPILKKRAELQVGESLERFKQLSQDGKAVLLWDWNNTLVDNFWHRLNQVCTLYKNATGSDVMLPPDIYQTSEASLTIAVRKLIGQYPDIIKYQNLVNQMVDDQTLLPPILDQRLPGIIDELNTYGFPSIGILTGSHQGQRSMINHLLAKYYPSLKNVPLLMYPECPEHEARSVFTRIKKDYQYTLLWKKMIARDLQPRLEKPILVIDNEPRQSALLNQLGNPNIHGFHLQSEYTFQPQISELISRVIV